MNIGSITIGRVENLPPREAAKSLADTCLMLAQLIVELNQEVQKLTMRVEQLEHRLR